MKKLLAIIVLGLLFIVNANAGSFNYSKYQTDYHVVYKKCMKDTFAYGNFDQNSKMFLDIEKCIGDKDVDLLMQNVPSGIKDNILFGMLDVVSDRYKQMWKLAGEISVDMIKQGNKQTHLKRYLSLRQQIWTETLNRQKMLANLGGY